MTTILPVTIDDDYLDQSAGDAAHQQHHDVLHALNNSSTYVEAVAETTTLFRECNTS